MSIGTLGKKLICLIYINDTHMRNNFREKHFADFQKNFLQEL